MEPRVVVQVRPEPVAKSRSSAAGIERHNIPAFWQHRGNRIAFQRFGNIAERGLPPTRAGCGHEVRGFRAEGSHPNRVFRKTSGSSTSSGVRDRNASAYFTPTRLPT